MSHAQAAAVLTLQADSVLRALRPVLPFKPCAEHYRLWSGEVTCALARQAHGPEWADLAARRVTLVLQQKGWLRTEDMSRARALARQALEPATAWKEPPYECARCEDTGCPDCAP